MWMIGTNLTCPEEEWWWALAQPRTGAACGSRGWWSYLGNCEILIWRREEFAGGDCKVLIWSRGDLQEEDLRMTDPGLAIERFWFREEREEDGGAPAHDGDVDPVEERARLLSSSPRHRLPLAQHLLERRMENGKIDGWKSGSTCAKRSGRSRKCIPPIPSDGAQQNSWSWGNSKTGDGAQQNLSPLSLELTSPTRSESQINCFN